MLKLVNHITIGNYGFNYICNSESLCSIDSLTATCSIELPRKLSFGNVDYTKLIKRGDKVTLQTGYNGELITTFKGYVRSINISIPVVFDCEDEMYSLKRTKAQDKLYSSVTLKSLLQEILPSGMKLEATDINLGMFRIANQPTVAKILDYIKQNYGVSFFFRDEVLFAVLPSTLITTSGIVNTITVAYGKNWIADNIETINPDDTEILIKAKVIKADNSVMETQYPETGDGEVRTFHAYWVNNMSELKAFAKQKYDEIMSTQSIRGSVTTFGVPVVFAGDRITLQDSRYPERDGKTFQIKSVKRPFGTGGYRQIIELGGQLS